MTRLEQAALRLYAATKADRERSAHEVWRVAQVSGIQAGGGVVSKIHWSAMSDTLRFACETDSRKCGHNAKHRSDLTACQYLAKHEQSPDLYCKRCARVAADMVPTDREEPGSVTFTAAEVEHLRGLVKYLARGWVGGNGAEGLRVLREKVGRD